MISKLGTFGKTPAMQWTLAYYFLFICLGLGTGLLGPTLPSLAEQTQTRVGQLGALFLAGSIGFTAGTALGGRVFDRVRGHPALGVAQLISAAFVMLIAFIPSFGLLLIAFVGKGAADGFINTGANTLLIWTHKEQSSPYMNGLHFCFGLGAFLAPFLVAQVVNVPGGYRWAYGVLALLGMLAGLRMLTLRGSPQSARASTSEVVAEGERADYRLVIAAMLFLFFYVGAEIAFAGWIYTYAFTLHLADATMAAYLTSGFWLSFTMGRLISIPLATRLAPARIIGLALSGCLVVLLAALLIPVGSRMVWIMAMALGFCMAPIWPSGFTLAGQSLHLTARLSGIILLGDSLGGMVLPWLVGQVLDVAGPQALIYLVFTSLIFNLLAFIAMLRLRQAAPERTVAAID